MNNASISIILPTYNRHDMIKNAIQSVIAQTVSDWELLVVDDGSTDATKEVVTAFAESDSRINYMYKENGGVSSARNSGIASAEGEYIAFIDSDDMWTPEKLEKQLAVFKADPSIGLVYTGIRFVDTRTGKERIKKAVEGGAIALQEIAYNPIGGPSRVMIKKECLSACGNFDETFLALEDWDLWIRITEKYPVGFVSEPCVTYNEHSDSLTYAAEKIVDGYEKLWQKHQILDRERWVRAVGYRRLGHRLCYGGVKNKGRQFFKKALRTEPLNPKNGILYVLSLLPVAVYRKVTHTVMKYAL
jgi:glycosyltransferase involved in cell wall biosynthesis